MENDEKAVKRLIELLGGHWGRIALEKQYEEAEIALFHLAQMQDESNDSYLARADVAWSKLQTRKLSLDDLQAYILLRGSSLNAEDKKRVILESDNSLEGKLTVKRVSEAVRLLGATFFHDMTGARKSTRTKVYGTTTLIAEDEEPEGAFSHMDDQGEEEYVDCLVNEGDEDATLVADFEAAAVELLQDDPELSSAFSAYTEARRRLSEKFKNRGFWTTSSRSTSQSTKGKFGSSKGSGKGKNAWQQKPRRSLQDRILNSYCRNCNRKGHWKAECPFRQSNSQASSTAAGGTTGSSSMPATAVSIDQQYQDVLPLEFLNLSEAFQGTIDDALPILVQTVDESTTQGTWRSGYHNKIHGESYGDNWITVDSPTPRERLKAWGLRNEDRVPAKMLLADTLRRQREMHPKHQKCVHAKSPLTESKHVGQAQASDVREATICFATHGSHGILDLGASKTVIGSDHVAELIQSLDVAVRQKLSRCACNITFRFGNQGTLHSSQALVIPVGPLLLKVAIVPGGTPFLISNTLMRAIEAGIDCASQTLSSHLLSSPIPLQLTGKGLFLIDVNQLITQSQSSKATGDPKRSRTCAETFVSDETNAKTAECSPKCQTNHHVNKTPEAFPKTVTLQEFNSTKSDQDQTVPSPPLRASETCSRDIRAQARTTGSSVGSTHRDTNHGITLPASSIVANSSNDDRGELGPPPTGRSGHGDHFVRPEAPGSFLSGSMGRSRMDPFHDQSLPRVDEREPSPIHEVHRAQDRGDGASTDCAASPPDTERAESSPSTTKAHGKEPSHAHLFAGWSRRLGCGVRDVHPSDYGLCLGPDLRGDDGVADPDVEHGKCIDTSDPSHRRAGPAEQGPPGNRGRLRDHVSPANLAQGPANLSELEQSIKGIKEDWNEDVFTTTHAETVELRKHVENMTAELHQVLRNVKPMGTQWTVGEVMCSSNSPITQQVLRCGHSAFRFGLEQGDLSTSTGRHELFTLIARHRPKHLWYSPTCGPWSSWSQLNASRSLYQQQMYQQMRKELQYQIALGIVLYRHQMETGNHFHWEQPQKSLMFQNPNLAEVHQHTQACQFDMCRAGSLVDPESQLPMKKGMTILTTFEPFFKRFHGLTCDSRHQHQAIEGSCWLPGHGRVLRSQYTEVYPRKFARAVAQVLSKGFHCRPYGWNDDLAAILAEADSRACPVFAVANKFRSKPQFPKSETVTPTSRASQENKRPKSDSLQGIAPTLEMCQQAVQAVNEELPRAGKREIHNNQTITMLQQVFPDKKIFRVMACRGTERTMAPPKGMHALEAPFRKMLMLRRDGEIQHEKHWERWADLSKRQLTRPSHACRVNITVFAKDFDTHASEVRPSSSTDMPITNDTTGLREVPYMPQDAPMVSGDKPADQPTTNDTASSGQPQFEETVAPPMPFVPGKTFESPEPSTEGETNTTPPVAVNPPLDPIVAQQSTLFRSLPKWEQQMILKLHKNLGHPSNERLSRALQVQGSRPEVVQAALEIRCAVCSAHAPPKHARPATLKNMIDFNHKVYLDGISWTNNLGKSFHLFHLLDAGTNYHVAIASPAKTSQDLIQLLNQHWISWAGPPTEMVVDSGTEMNSQEFAEFTQRFNIRTTTTAPEAHWQSGKIERHGAFLQSMLSKVDLEYPITNYDNLQQALNQRTHAKNSLSIRHGYAPEVIVFGKHTRLAGSVLSDDSLPSHEQAMQEEAGLSPLNLRQTLAVREAARRAFHVADNSDVLRRALLRRACPSRGMFTKGEWVMTWKGGPLNQHRWSGPHRVIIQDDHHTVWCTSHGKLIRSAPENTRKSLPEEGSPEGPELPADITPMTQQIARMNQVDNQSTDFQEIPLDTTNELDHQNLPSNNPSHDEPDNPNNDQSDSQDESIPQPDQEPGNLTPEESQNHPSEMPEEETTESASPAEQELLYLTCHEPTNAFTCKDAGTLSWSCEFDIPLEESLQERTPNAEETWLLLATATKKQRTEVKLSNLSAAEFAEFQKAKQAEVDNWIKTGTISAILKNQIPEEQILRCRWILTWKPLDTANQKEDTKLQKEAKTTGQTRSHKAKARLVVLGYLDPKLEEVPRDSPTLNKTSRMIVLQTISSHSWKMRSFDIKAAFLQGQPQADRVIAIDPVPELRKAMNLKPHEVCRLNKGAYGLIDAPYLWYCALVSELLRLGFEACPFDPCCFVLRTPATKEHDSRLEGILGIHVDDGIGGGSPVFEEAIKQLEKTFPFGSHKVSAFTFTGIELNQHHDFSITMNQSAYVRKINPITIETNRKSQLENPVTEPERLALRGLVGSVQYAAINTRPDLSSKLSFLQSTINHAKIENLMEANRLLHEAKKHHEVTITIKPIPYPDFRFLAFSDASFSSATKPDSHAGSIIVGTHRDINQNCQCPISPLTWGCRKIQKVVTSTLSAETMALSSTLDQLSWLRLFWSWIHDPTVQWKKPEDALQKLAPAITVPTKSEDADLTITDCKSLFDMITRTAPPSCSEFRVQLMARAIKESLREGTILRWVPSGAQFADSLTKAMESNFLRETLRLGYYKLCDEASTLRERAKTKDRLRWLRSQPESHSNKI